jgi:type IV fimbrial biogenesis protein FimT
MCSKEAGFTLIEAVIAMAVVAVLFAIAVPAWTNARAAVHNAATLAALEGSLLDAVRHAGITATEVVICPSSDAGHCSGSSDWSDGWIVFADLDADRNRDANETLLRRASPLEGGVRLRSTEGRTRLVFQPNGGNAGSNVTFTLCDGRGPAKATTLVISNSGQLHYGVPTSAAAQSCAYGR